MIQPDLFAWEAQHAEALNAWEREAKARIKAMGESARRSIGQHFRHAKARLQHQGDLK